MRGIDLSNWDVLNIEAKPALLLFRSGRLTTKSLMTMILSRRGAPGRDKQPSHFVPATRSELLPLCVELAKLFQNVSWRLLLWRCGSSRRAAAQHEPGESAEYKRAVHNPSLLFLSQRLESGWLNAITIRDHVGRHTGRCMHCFGVEVPRSGT